LTYQIINWKIIYIFDLIATIDWKICGPANLNPTITVQIYKENELDEDKRYANESMKKK
jgi:hypothetical protein